MAFAPSLAFDYLRRAHEGDRLGHAYLVTGGNTATFQLATRLAAMVARAKNADAAAVLANPDVHVVEPESKSRRIVIEQMRELEGALRLRASVDGARKVGIVREADRLQPQAANAFLKTLEEPPAGSLLLLLSAQPESIMETILSRCIKVSLRDAPAAEGGGDAPTREEATLLELLARFVRERSANGGTSSLPVAYRMARDFSGLLSAAKSRLQAEGEAALKREEARYAQTTDGTWLSEREAYYKSLTEARYAGERVRLVSALARWWGDVLRVQSTGGEGASSAEVAALAASLSPGTVLRRLTAIEELRENLDRNIQEALALEVAFLHVFGA